MRKAYLLFCFSLLSFSTLFAQKGSVSGRILDAKTGETLIGVTVGIEGTTLGALTDLEGNFLIKEVDAGDKKLFITYVGYDTYSTEVTVEENQDKNVGDIKISSTAIGLEEVEVFASVVKDRKTPVAVSSITVDQIEQRLGGMEFPEILNSTPGIYATPGAGAFGESRVNVRGFDQRNVAVMINGVPVNDMTNGWVFWSNWAGLSEVTRKMEVQRGLGATKLAVNSVGGTINMVIKPAENKKGGRAEYSFGTGTWSNRISLTLHTGLMKGGWAVSFQGSRTTGDGYRPGTYADAWAYFLSASKQLGEKHSLVFTAFGAPQTHGGAFGTSQADYEKRNNVFYNSSWGYYNGQLLSQNENKYHKPQISLNHYWDISDKTKLATSVYLSTGRGYGAGINRSVGSKPLNSDGQTDWEGMAEDNRGNVQTILNPNGDPNAASVTGAQSVYILRRSHNDHNWAGVVSTLNSQITDRFNIVAGIDLRAYQGLHYRKVADLLGGDFWVDQFNGNDNNILVPNRIAHVGDVIDYNYTSNVRWAGFFTQAEYSFEKIDIFLTGTASQTQFWRDGKFWSSNATSNSLGESEKKDFFNYSAKGGFNFRLDARNNVFFNGGYFTRAPFFNSSFVDNRYNNRYAENLASEKVAAGEVGYGYRAKRLKVNLNGYYTVWKDRTFSITQEGQDGTQRFNITGQDALHKGVEMDFSANLLSNLELTGMVSVGDWRWKNDVNAIVTNDQNQDVIPVNVFADNIKVGDAAQTTAFLGINYKLKDFYIGARYNYFDNLYVQFDPSTRGENNKYQQAEKLPAYDLVDIYLGYNFKVADLKARVKANVHNVLGNRYLREGTESFGGQVTYGFGRTFNASISVNF